SPTLSLLLLPLTLLLPFTFPIPRRPPSSTLFPYTTLFRSGLRIRRTPRLLCRPGTGDVAVRNLDPRRPFLASGEQDPQKSVVLVRVRCVEGPVVEGLLRQETCRA